ncbi:MAG: hypothetical protein HYX27_19535 [Acidobacteria bacterium]|nr:hypothetical protein [Acidobacteriota bacterium]
MRWLLAALILLTACARNDAQQAEYERKFQESMNNVTLFGYSTRLNKEGTFGPEKYKIESISKISGDTWMFKTRLRMEGKDIPLPLPITVKWAGDTPMISLTGADIPGMGTYTARVMLYRDQYAGTWSGKRGGGQMFGKIVKGD